jgi:ribosomal protein L16 Arg81 hydroxylase/predicted enzyme related to lactoylglutathione lyase
MSDTARVDAPSLERTASPSTEPFASRLSWLVHPLSPQEFVDSYWQTRPLHITGWADRFEGLFDLATLREAVTRQHETGISIRVSHDRRGDSGGADRHVVIDASEISGYLQRGASVCVDPVDWAVPALHRLAADLKRELCHSGDVSVKCYLSPDGYGFNTHFDADIVTTLQIEGRKRWLISRRPGVPFPLDNAFLDDHGEIHYIGRPPSALRSWEVPPYDADDVVAVDLEPGDVLCLPAGTWHNAKADGYSLALNVAFHAGDALSLFTAALAERLQDSPGWRAGLPVAADPAYGDQPPQSVAARLDACVDELVTALRSPELRQHVVRLWREAVGGAPPPATGLHPAQAPQETPSPQGNGTTRGDVRLQCVLGVADAAAAARWYERVLGCEVISSIPSYGWVELSTPAPGVTLGLTEDRGAAVPGGALLDFAVPDVEAMRTSLVEAGARVDERVRRVSGMATFLGAEDPDGNRLMFYDAGG